LRVQILSLQREQSFSKVFACGDKLRGKWQLAFKEAEVHLLLMAS
jgi:hypothetical protein